MKTDNASSTKPETIQILTESEAEPEANSDTKPEQKPFNYVPVIAIVLLAGLGIGGGLVYKKYFYKPKMKEENRDDEESV